MSLLLNEGDDCIYSYLSPSPDSPSPISSVGDLVEEGEYAGKYAVPVNINSDFSDTIPILGVENDTNYAYFSADNLPNAEIGDIVCLEIDNSYYYLQIKKKDTSYIYIENKEV